MCRPRAAVENALFVIVNAAMRTPSDLVFRWRTHELTPHFGYCPGTPLQPGLP